MSAEGPTPRVEPPLPRSQVVKSNQRQVLLYVVLTLLLTVATVWGARALLTDTETLTFAVGAPNSEEAQFAGKLAAVLKNTHARLRLKILPNGFCLSRGTSSFCYFCFCFHTWLFTPTWVTPARVIRCSGWSASLSH